MKQAVIFTGMLLFLIGMGIIIGWLFAFGLSNCGQYPLQPFRVVAPLVLAVLLILLLLMIAIGIDETK